MSSARERRTSHEVGRSSGAAATGLAPGKQTLVESQYGGVAGPNRGAMQEAKAGQTEPPQKRTAEAPRTQATQVTSVFRKGTTTPETSLGGYTPNPDAVVAEQRVAPSGAPTVHAGGGNSCTPGVEVLDWTVVDAGANWRADVTALRVSGDIHITDWPSHPTTMTTPNTPNPVDGGNINNTAGSANHWQAAIDDMVDYDTAGGGAGPNWHSTAASRAHEWAHWNDDYLGACIPAGNWAQTNQDIDALTVPKAGHADAAAARAALQPRVEARFNQFVAAVTRHWNNVVSPADVPGGGGRGYAAGTRVLNGLIGSVRTYATTKGWDRRPAHEAPSGAMPAGDAGGTPAAGGGTHDGGGTPPVGGSGG